jgi:HD superfamily phosphohydrolase YqeK
MRRLCYEDLDRAMLEALSFQISDLVSRRSPVYEETIEAYHFFAEMTV